jgi:chromate transport protein ChrA
MKDAALPVIMIVLGLAWLLDSLHWLPNVHWLWILGLAGAGAAIMVLDGITKSSIVAGPLLMLAGLLSFFRQYYGLGWRFIVPILLIAAGSLMLAARSPAIPDSRRFNHRFHRRAGDGDRHD